MVHTIPTVVATLPPASADCTPQNIGVLNVHACAAVEYGGIFFQDSFAQVVPSGLDPAPAIAWLVETRFFYHDDASHGDLLLIEVD